MFPQIPSDLSALSNDELASLLDELVGAFNEASASDSIDDETIAALSGVADGVDALRAEQNTRAEVAAARAEEVATLASRINAQVTEPDAEPEPTPETEPTREPPAEPVAEPEPQVEPAQPVAIAAAAQRRPASLATMRANTPIRSRPRTEDAPVSIVAAAGIPGVNPGTPITDGRQIAELMVERHRNLGRGDGDNVPVVQFQLNADRSRHLNRDRDVLEQIKGFDRSRNGIQAAGGLCAPVNNYYGQMVIANAERPVRDALANFTADRGGIRFNPPPTLDLITSGVATMTAAADLAMSPGTKSCFTVTCPTITEVDITAIYNCLTFGNFGARAFPEQVEAWTALALALQARVGEQLLLDAIATGSTSVTSTGLVGAGREVFARIGQVAAGYRSRHRLNDVALRVLLPAWLPDMVQADWARTFTDEPAFIGADDAEIARLFGVRDLNVTWYLDSKTGGGQVFGAASGERAVSDGVLTNSSATVTSATGAFTQEDVGKTVTGTGIPAGDTIKSVESATSMTLTTAVGSGAGATGVGLTFNDNVAREFPRQVYAYIFAEGSWLHLDAGTLDLGLVRDSTLNSTNQFRTFTESFENAALVGPESVELVMTLNADGSYGAAKSITNPINS